MRTCRSILAVIFMLVSVSCQSVPQNPVARTAGPPVATAPHETPPVYIPEDSGLNTAGSDENKDKISKKVTLGDEKKPPKKSPIKPVISPVQTGLLTPQTQEVTTGAAPGVSEKQRIVLNFEKADVSEVTSQIFSDQLKLSYVLDQTLQGRISMYIEGDFDNEELLEMVTRAYEANGISIIPRKGFYFIQLSQKAGGAAIPMADKELLAQKGSRPLIVIYRLRFMDQKQAANLIGPFMTPGRKTISDPSTNSIIFLEDTDNARVLINLLKTIDINVLKEVSMEIVPLNSITPADAVQGMESLMGKLGAFKESALKNSLALLPLNNFGGVLVMAQNPELLKSAKQWLQALDVRETGKQEEIYVYFVQNGLARDIATIVGAVLGITQGGGMGQQIVPSGTARGTTTTTFGAGAGGLGGGGLGGGGFGGGIGSGTGGMGMGGFGTGGTGMGGLGTTGTGTTGAFGSTMGGGMAGSTYGTSASRTGGTASRTGAGVVGTTGPGGPPKPGSIFTGEVMLIPDEVNNAIVIRANAVDYGKIKKAVETLDLLPRAVLIEVMIAEVDLTKDFIYGLQYWFQTHALDQKGYGISFGGLSNQQSTVSSGTTTTSAGFPNLGALAGQGVALSWVANAENMAVFLNALADKTNVTVLSTPTLLTTDNTEASIAVGGQQPIPTGSVTGSSTGGTDIFSTIQYQATGVILDITPHINAGGLVRLELQQQVVEVGPNASVGSGQTAPTFTQRQIKTTLLAQNGKTVIIGGIISSNKQDGKTGIPYLQDIPLLSPLFSTRTSNLQRTELLVAITPHVVDQRGSQAPIELLQKLQNLRQRADH